MRGRSALLITGLAVASLVASTAATARPIDKGHFHDVFTSDVYDCNGTPAQDSGDVSGNFVLKDPGQVRIAFDIDYNGTPGDPSDDVEVPDSFRVVRGSTGNSDLSDRDFCADLVEFTS